MLKEQYHYIYLYNRLYLISNILIHIWWRWYDYHVFKYLLNNNKCTEKKRNKTNLKCWTFKIDRHKKFRQFKIKKNFNKFLECFAKEWTIKYLIKKLNSYKIFEDWFADFNNDNNDSVFHEFKCNVIKMMIDVYEFVNLINENDDIDVNQRKVQLDDDLCQKLQMKNITLRLINVKVFCKK